MFKFLSKPYPFNDDLKHNTRIIFILSIGVALLLLIFQPFEISEFTLKEKIYTVMGIGLVTFISLSFNLLFLPSYFPKLFIFDKWNIKKEILWNSWILLTISTGFFLYNELSGFSGFDFSFITIIKTILLSMIPISVLISINQDRMLRLNIKSASELTEKIRQKKVMKQKEITIESEYQKGSLTLKVMSILFIRSAGNYIEIFWEDEKEVKNQMIRVSLKKTEELLSEYDFIFKCHRSHLVNMNKIAKVEGNYQGYKIFLTGFDDPVPVSRNYSTEFQKLF